jgi:hypothetical protein
MLRTLPTIPSWKGTTATRIQHTHKFDGRSRVCQACLVPSQTTTHPHSNTASLGSRPVSMIRPKGYEPEGLHEHERTISNRLQLQLKWRQNTNAQSGRAVSHEPQGHVYSACINKQKQQNVTFNRCRQLAWVPNAIIEDTARRTLYTFISERSVCML